MPCLHFRDQRSASTWAALSQYLSWEGQLEKTGNRGSHVGLAPPGEKSQSELDK